MLVLVVVRLSTSDPDSNFITASSNLVGNIMRFYTDFITKILSSKLLFQ